MRFLKMLRRGSGFSVMLWDVCFWCLDGIEKSTSFN